MTSCAPVASIAARSWPVLGRWPGTSVEDLGACLGEQLGQAGTGGHHHQLAAAPLGPLLPGARDLLGEVGDLDPAWCAGADAGLDGGADVVDVDVHVPQPLATDDDQRVAQRSELLAQVRDGLVVGLEEVHHLVRRPLLAQVTRRELGHRDRRGADVGGGRGGALPRDRGLGCVQDHAQPATARVHHACILEQRQLLGCPGESLHGGAGGRMDHVAEAVLRDLGRVCGGLRRRPRHGQDRALDRLADSCVRRVGGQRHAFGEHRRRAVLGSGPADPAQQGTHQLAQDHSRVAAGTEQRSPRVGLHRCPQVAGVLVQCSHHGVPG